jgi:hypothetical protein
VARLIEAKAATRAEQLELKVGNQSLGKAVRTSGGGLAIDIKGTAFSESTRDDIVQALRGLIENLKPAS